MHRLRGGAGAAPVFLIAFVTGMGLAWSGPPARAITVSSPTAGSADSVVVAMVDGQLPSAQDAAVLAASLGTTVTGITALSNDFARVEFGQDRPIAQVRAAALAFANDPAVAAAEPDLRLGLAQAAPDAPNDPRFPDQWGLWQAAAPAGGYSSRVPVAWLQTRGSSAVTVAVLDTGVTAHPDLPAALNGYDFVSSAALSGDGDGRDSGPIDPGDACGGSVRSSWHGTHIAGIIAARTGNAEGVAGIAPGVTLQSVRVLGCAGVGAASDISDGVTWASGGAVPGVPANPNPAQVINVSLSGSYASCPAVLADAISGAIGRGANVVAAAGNSNSDAAGSIPANCPGVISVAATDHQGARASYSNFGASVSIAAPGGEASAGILSTFNSGTTTAQAPDYEAAAGTSMATAQVAGVLALVRSAHPNWTAKQAWARVAATVAPFAINTGRDCAVNTCGVGMLDAGAAVFPRSGAVGSLAGSLWDASGAPLAGVAVSAVNAADGAVAATTSTARDGRFSLDQLAPGVYGVRQDGTTLGLPTQFWPHASRFTAAGAVRLDPGASVAGLVDVLVRSTGVASPSAAPVATPALPKAVAGANVSGAAGSGLSAARLNAHFAGKLTPARRVTLTARFTPAVATGSVVFRDASRILGSARVARGKAVLRVRGLYGGRRVLTATFGPTSDHQAAVAVLKVRVRDQEPPTLRIRKFTPRAAGSILAWQAGDAGGVARVRVETRAGWTGRWESADLVGGALGHWQASARPVGSTVCYRLQAVDYAGNRSRWKTVCGVAAG